MVQAIAAFIEFCYLARRSVHSDKTIAQLDAALKSYHELRMVFQHEGIRPEGFDSLPRQHSLFHYPSHIRNFGAPNGLCSSITEAMHIRAVKEPWRRSSRFKALSQMLLTIQRLDKLKASRVDFTARGMLAGSCLTTTVRSLEAAHEHAAEGDEPGDAEEDEYAELQDIIEAPDDEDDGAIEGPRVAASVSLAKRHGTSYTSLVDFCSDHSHQLPVIQELHLH